VTGGSERLLEVRRTFLSDDEETIGKAGALFAANALQPLTKGPPKLCEWPRHWRLSV
jgi:hypothetical protein